MRFLLCFSLCLMSSANLLAQFNLGAKISYLHTFNSNATGHFGFGLRGEAGLLEDIAIQGGFNYFVKADYEHVYEAKAKTTLIQPQTIPVFTRSNVRFYHFYLGVKKYFMGEHNTFKKEEGISVYGAADIGVLVAGYTTVADSTDNISRVMYDLPLKDTQLGAFTDINVNVSLGFEKKLGSRFYLYGEAKALVKAYQASSSTVLDFKVPVAFISNLGFRVPFGENY